MRLQCPRLELAEDQNLPQQQPLASRLGWLLEQLRLNPRDEAELRVEKRLDSLLVRSPLVKKARELLLCVLHIPVVGLG